LSLLLYRRAGELSGRGNHGSAIKYSGDLVTSGPQFSSALSEMRYCYEKHGWYPEAVAKCDPVFQMYPPHGEAGMNENRILDPGVC